MIKIMRPVLILCLLLPVITWANTVKLTSTVSPVASEYIALSADWHMNINRGNPDPFINSFDSSHILNKLSASLGLSEQEKGGLKADLKVSVKSMTDKMIKGYIKVISAQPRANRKNEVDMLVRLDYGSQGLMYLGFQAQRKNDKIQIIDWMNYSTGFTLSESLAKLHRLQRQSTNAQAKLLNLFFSSVKNNEHSQALTIYKKLAVKLQQDPMILLLKTEAAATDEPIYIRALGEFAKSHGNNPKYEWIMVDYYYYQQDYKSAHRLLESFSKKVMQDAAIYAIQGSFAYVNNDYATAVRYCQKALMLDPDYRDTYLTLLYALIGNQNYKEAVLVLQILQKRFQFQLDPMILSSFDGFDDFSKSESFQKWAEQTMSVMDPGF